jgi:hypothetical protein
MNIRPLGNKRGFGRSCDEIWALVLPRTDLQSTEDSLRPEGKQAMRIDRSEFGSITVDGKTYDHDVMIGLSGRVSKRKKKLSKQQYGTSHVVSKAEAKAVFEKGSDVIIIGSGHEGNVRLSPEAEDYFAKKRCEVLLQPTQKAIRSFNRSAKRKIALMHVTC